MGALISGCGSRDDIPIVDTHIHLYDTTRAEKLEWPLESDAVLYRPVLPADFGKECDENGLTATVIVEASSRFSDNQWVLDLVKGEPDRYIGLVGSLEVGTSSFAANLKTLSADKRFVGIRLRERPRGVGYFNEDVWRDLQLLADAGKTLDVLMFEFSLEDVNQIGRRLPKLKILMNHVAGANIDGKPVDPVWAQQLARAAHNPNVYCKVSGLFQQSHQQPSPTDLAFYKPVLDDLWKEFGEDRLIYGSNWPVTMRGGSYASYKSVVMEFLSPRDVPLWRRSWLAMPINFTALSRVGMNTSHLLLKVFRTHFKRYAIVLLFLPAVIVAQEREAWTTS